MKANVFSQAGVFKTPIFETARLGCKQTRVPAVVFSARGTLVAFCEARYGEGDWTRIDIVCRRSCDQGETWDEVATLARSEGGPVSNPTPIACVDGTLHILFHRDYARCFHSRSDDDGVTWSPPRDITPVFDELREEYDWRVLAPGPGHAVELRNGRLVVPVWLCNPKGDDHRPSCVSAIHSDDGGESWHRGEIVIPNGANSVNPSETTLAELSSGCVLLNARNESPQHRRLVSTSLDGAMGWSGPVFDEALFDGVCMGSLMSLRDSSGAHVLLFSSPCPDDRREWNELHFCSRENGTIRLSRDDGASWQCARVIESGPFAYSDLAASPSGTVFCLYETGPRGEPPHHQNTHVALARFTLDWLESPMART